MSRSTKPPETRALYAPSAETTNPTWRDEAICKDEDPELFFPIGHTGPALLQIEQAKAVCRRCPITEECLSWALESGQDNGVWGGMSEDERRAIKRRGGLQAGASALSSSVSQPDLTSVSPISQVATPEGYLKPINNRGGQA